MKRTTRKLTNEEIIDNLRPWLVLAMEHPKVWNAGFDWYTEAQDFVYKMYDMFRDRIEGLTPYRVASTVSSLSPNNRWERNMIDTVTVLTAVAEGLSPESVKVCTYNPNKLKAFACAKGDTEITAKSPKTHAFAMNVGLNSPNHITVDKWHIRACLGRPEEGIYPAVETCTASEYRRIESITAELAVEFDLKGYQAQATIWVMIKKIWNR